MAYTYTTFGGITLPVYNRDSDLSPVAAVIRLTPTAAGAFDADGTRRSARRYPHPLTIDAIVSESTAAAQRTAIDALRAAVGTRATLTRQADSDAATHTATCRLTGMTQARSYSQRGYQPVSLQFAQLTPWRAATATTYSATFPYAHTMTAASAQLTLANAGNLPVTAVTMTLSTVGAAIFTPQWTATGHDLTVDDDTVGSDYVLTVDGGSMTVRQVFQSGSPENFYGVLVLGSAHTIDSWFRLEPGNTVMTLALHTLGNIVTWGASFFAEYA
jgi:hypothetical protein